MARLNGIILELRGQLIAQGGQRRARARIVGEALPFQIAVEFRENGRQIFGQPFAVSGGQGFDGGFDFGNGAHRGTNYSALAVR